MHADIDGRPHRIYFEEAGPADGIPLLWPAHRRLRRTAVSAPSSTIRRSRRRSASSFFDLPWHGKSSPPPGLREGGLPGLTTAPLCRHRDDSWWRRLGLDRPGGDGLLDRWPRGAAPGAAAMGAAFPRPRSACSRRSMPIPRRQFPALARRSSLIHRPDGPTAGDVSAAFIACLMAPDLAVRRPLGDAVAHISQVRTGRIHGRSSSTIWPDGDMRQSRPVAARCAGVCPALSAHRRVRFIGDARRLTAALAKTGVNAAHFRGDWPGPSAHFPMSEAPERFLGHLRPVLCAHPRVAG